MIIKSGTFVNHTGAIQWGTGKIMEVGGTSVTIQFSDGIIRKISSSHYANLLQADSASFVPPPEIVQVPPPATAKKTKKAAV